MLRRYLGSSSNHQAVKFRDLAQFIKTKTTVDEAHVRELITNQQFKPLAFLGKGRFGKVYLCSRKQQEPSSSKLYAVKVLNVERDRREYNWTWLTKEERLQAKTDATSLHDFISQLSPGVVRDHMLRAEELLQDTMTREENPQLRRIRRPVAEREILLRMGAHPAVCNLLTSFRDNRFMCLVFEYFPNSTLNALVERTKGLDEHEARFFAAQLLVALAFLQEKNVCHRDVKPSNILLDEHGFIALADFGLATRLRGGLKNMCGTVEYIAPEVLSEPMWSASGLDLWAFGITLFNLLTGGRTPFDGPDATSVFLNTLTAPVRFPPSSKMSEEAKDLISQLLTKETARRPSMAQVKQHGFFSGVDWDGLLRKDAALVPASLQRKLKEEAPRLALHPLSSSSSPATSSTSPPLRRFDSLLK